MKLKKGKILYIDNIKYTVLNMVEYKEDTWIWQEYEIFSNSGRGWLTIEEGENNNIEYWLYTPIRASINTKAMTVTYNNKNYELYEKGTARVKGYFGAADVDINEACEYFDYISEDKSEILSIEKWIGETEKSIGTNIPSGRIQITQEVEKVAKSKNAVAVSIAMVLLFVVLPIVVGIVSCIDNNSMRKYLGDTAKYKYVTSVTSNTTKSKAKVYKSPLSTIDATVKDIINGVPEGITKTIDSEPGTDEDGIGLETKNEYAYIYEEDGAIYVQVSDKKYVETSGTTYHTTRHYYYYRTYRSNNTSSEYTSYANSAKQNSINSRKSSGGGTSAGK